MGSLLYDLAIIPRHKVDDSMNDDNDADPGGVRDGPVHQSNLLGAASCAPESCDMVVVCASTSARAKCD